VIGLSYLLDTVERVQEYGNTDLKISGLLLTRYNNRTVINRELKESLEAKAAEMNSKLYAAVIRENVSIREAQTARRDIFSYAPKSNGAVDYMEFLNEYIAERG
jgi:chromosome partitioning protein